MTNFSNDLAWSLKAANTSTAVTLLSAVWPACSWVTTCSVTDQAGVDLLGLRDGLSPVRIDAKFRRVTPERRRWFDPEDPDALLDVEYKSNDGQRRPGPVRRYDGNRMTPPADYYLFAYPGEEPPVGLLVDAQQAHFWLATSYQGLKLLTSSTVREDGLTWTTSFVAAPGSLLNAVVARNTARLLTVSNGQVVMTFPG